MTVRHTASIVADILSTVESDTNSENDDEGSQLSTDIEELGEDLGGDEDVSTVDPRDNSTATGPTVEDENNSVTGCSSSNLIPKKGTKSDVWRHFGLQHKDGMAFELDKPVCRLCLVKVSAKDGNTTNLFAHLKTKHPEMYLEVKKLSSKTEKLDLLNAVTRINYQ